MQRRRRVSPLRRHDLVVRADRRARLDRGPGGAQRHRRAGRAPDRTLRVCLPHRYEGNAQCQRVRNELDTRLPGGVLPSEG